MHSEIFIRLLVIYLILVVFCLKFFKDLKHEIRQERCVEKNEHILMDVITYTPLNYVWAIVTLYFVFKKIAKGVL